MDAKRLSYRRAAKLMNVAIKAETGEAAGVNESSFRNWISRGIVPQPDSQRALIRVLGISQKALVKAIDDQLDERRQRHLSNVQEPTSVHDFASAHDDTDETVVRILDAHEHGPAPDEDDELKRRELLGHLAGIVAAIAAPGRQPLQITTTILNALNTAPFDNSQAKLPWAHAVRTAVIDPRSLPITMDSATDLPKLRDEVRAVMAASFASKHTVIGAGLPPLIALLERLVDVDTDDNVRALLQLLADAYSVAGWTLIKADDASIASLGER